MGNSKLSHLAIVVPNPRCVSDFPVERPDGACLLVCRSQKTVSPVETRLALLVCFLVDAQVGIVAINIFGAQQDGQPPVLLLQKPFTRETLVVAIQLALASS